MSEATPEAPASPEGGNPSGPTPTADEFTPITSQEEFDKALSKRLERERAKFSDYDDLKSKVKDFEKQQRSAMTDAERAQAEAEERGRTAAATEFGHELARTRFDALAGRRNKDFDTAQALEFVDLGKFLGEDGRPDDKAITAAVERLVPAPADGAPSFDGGTRTPPPAQQGMTGLIRKAAGRA